MKELQDPHPVVTAEHSEQVCNNQSVLSSYKWSKQHGISPAISCHASKTPKRLLHRGGVHATAAIVTPCPGGRVVLIHRGLRCETYSLKTGVLPKNTTLMSQRGWGTTVTYQGERVPVCLARSKHRMRLGSSERMLPPEGQRPSRKEGSRRRHPGETWLPCVHMTAPPAWHEYRPGRESEIV